MNSNNDTKALGFDHVDGAAKIPKSKSSSSRRLKAAFVYGRTLDSWSHDKTAKNSRRKRKNQKARRMTKSFVSQGLAPKSFLYGKDELLKVSYDKIAAFRCNVHRKTKII